MKKFSKNSGKLEKSINILISKKIELSHQHINTLKRQNYELENKYQPKVFEYQQNKKNRINDKLNFSKNSSNKAMKENLNGISSLVERKSGKIMNQKNAKILKMDEIKGFERTLSIKSSTSEINLLNNKDREYMKIDENYNFLNSFSNESVTISPVFKGILTERTLNIPLDENVNTQRIRSNVLEECTFATDQKQTFSFTNSENNATIAHSIQELIHNSPKFIDSEINDENSNINSNNYENYFKWMERIAEIDSLQFKILNNCVNECEWNSFLNFYKIL